MKMFLLMLLLLPVVSDAVEWDENRGLLFVDPDSDSSYIQGTYTSSPFEKVTAYLLIKNPTGGAVQFWDLAVEVSGEPIAPSWELLAGLDADSDENSFAVTIVPPFIAPNESGSVLLAVWTGFIMGPYDGVYFNLMTRPGSSSETPYYLGDGGISYEIQTHSSCCEFFINNDFECCVQPAETVDWTSLKVFYR